MTDFKETIEYKTIVEPGMINAFNQADMSGLSPEECLSESFKFLVVNSTSQDLMKQYSSYRDYLNKDIERLKLLFPNSLDLCVMSIRVALTTSVFATNNQTYEDPE